MIHDWLRIWHLPFKPIRELVSLKFLDLIFLLSSTEMATTMCGGELSDSPKFYIYSNETKSYHLIIKTEEVFPII